MFTHAQVWSAIDGLAREHSMSASGLARKAGLDATSFNRSKRINSQGRERWPSMESVAKVLAVTGEPLEQFAKRISSEKDGRLPTDFQQGASCDFKGLGRVDKLPQPEPH